jgi:hypothetical protein
VSIETAVGAVQEIEQSLDVLAMGGDNAPALARIRSLLDVVREEARVSTDVFMKVGELRDWIDILSNPEKYERFGGFERVRGLTRASCGSLREVLRRLRGPDPAGA